MEQGMSATQKKLRKYRIKGRPKGLGLSGIRSQIKLKEKRGRTALV